MERDELDERIEVLRSCGFIDDTQAVELARMAETLVRECGVPRDSEVLATLVTHVAAALKRVREGEPVSPLPQETLDDVRESPVFEEARRIQQKLLGIISTELPDAEKDFVLVHVGGLLISRANE